MKPTVKFSTFAEENLSPADMKNLTLLYQPIMGVDAFSLYLNLFQQPMNIEIAHDSILVNSIKSMEIFIDARNKLEAIGLIDVYQTQTNLIYILKKPLLASLFFHDAILRTFLFLNVGASSYNRLKKLFPQLTFTGNEKKITKRFDEVFDISVASRIEPISPISKKIHKISSEIELKNGLDVIMLERIFKRKGMDFDKVQTEVLTLLDYYAYLYKFDLYELTRLTYDSMEPSGEINIEILKKLAKSQFQLVSKGEKLVVHDKLIEAESNTVKVVKNEDSLFKFFDQHPMDFLQNITGGLKIVPKDLQLIDWMYTEQELASGVINVILQYVLVYTDGKLPKRLVEEIVAEWQRTGVDTIQKALKRIDKSLEKRGQYKANKQQKQYYSNQMHQKKFSSAEPVPAWLSKIDEKVDKTKEQELLDLQAKERIREMKKQFLMEESGYGKA